MYIALNPYILLSFSAPPQALASNLKGHRWTTPTNTLYPLSKYAPPNKPTPPPPHTHAPHIPQTLASILERMALDHPYHTLYSLVALRNGNLGRNGQPVPTAAVAGALARQEVDMDKVGGWVGVGCGVLCGTVVSCAAVCCSVPWYAVVSCGMPLGMRRLCVLNHAASHIAPATVNRGTRPRPLHALCRPGASRRGPAGAPGQEPAPRGAHQVGALWQ